MPNSPARAGRLDWPSATGDGAPGFDGFKTAAGGGIDVSGGAAERGLPGKFGRRGVSPPPDGLIVGKRKS